jgi:tRNA pseudouridine55 synthase
VNRVKRSLLEELLRSVQEPDARKALKKKFKVGHAGTLDPLASGLLILCTGPMTKRIDTIQAQEKEYTGTVTLGAVTPTYDLESSPENFKSTEEITTRDILAAAEEFTGKILQYPPAHSAVLIDGKRAYELARKGLEVAVKPREVEIKSLEISNINLPTFDFKVICSKGTYIRSLAHDIGQKLGCGGYLSALRRTRIGNYRVEDAASPTAIHL